MEKQLPKDIENGVMLFEKAFSSDTHYELIRTFKDAIYTLNDSSGDFPLYSKDIDDLKFSNMVRLLCNLNSNLPDPDYRIWLEYILVFCIDLKPEIKKLYTTDPSLFERLLAYLAMYSEEITQELKENITSVLNEIRS